MAIATLTVIVALLLWQNRKLMQQLALLSDRQADMEGRLDKLTRKTKKATFRQRQFDRRLEQQRRKQVRLAKAQEHMQKEQTRQAEQLSKPQFDLVQAMAEIDAGNTRIAQLFALLDIAEANRAAAMPGSREEVRYQKQIISLEQQIYATQKRIAKAEYTQKTARQKLAA